MKTFLRIQPPKPLFLLVILLFILACNKDSNLEIPIKSTNQNITLEEIKAVFGNSAEYVRDRNEARLPFDVIPFWDSTYFYNDAPFPIILTFVDSTTLYQDSRHGGNLAFYKDNQGKIRSVLLMWQADSLTPYLTGRAPLESTCLFSGIMLSVDDRDTIRKIAKLRNGEVILANSGAFPADQISPDSIKNNFVFDRDGDDDGPKTGCRGPGCESWWNKLLEAFGAVGSFFANLWGEPGSIPSTSGGGFFFWGNYYPNIGNQNDWSFVPASGGSGVLYQEYSNFNTTCAYIRQYIIAVEAFPPEYYQVNYRLCELMDELGLGLQAGDEGFCLYLNQNNAIFEAVWSYWEASDKSPSTADKLKAYLEAGCSEHPSVLMAEVIKSQYCLNDNTIDLWSKLINECGYDFVPGSLCVKNIVIQDRINYINQNYNISITIDDINYLSQSNTIFSCNPSIYGAVLEEYNKIWANYDAPPEGNPLSLPEAFDCFEDVCTSCSYSVTLYLEQPVPGTRELYTTEGGTGGSSGDGGSSYRYTGHSFLGLSQYDPVTGDNKTRMLGFYPYSKPRGQESVPAAFWDDSETTYNISVTWPITHTQFDLIKEELTAYHNYGLYNVKSINCTTVLKTALEAGGMSFWETRRQVLLLGWIDANPADFGEDLRINPQGGTFYSTTGATLITAPLSNCE